ncbi:hypothetical protein V8V93_04465 [Pseudodesulfovibrio methanolicus]|uniref:Uncharacterized protein n=1 Tax=Pseudodesulfovibrio methanolicus TaxID=3126690 RepID=A0ABZ2J1K8_9BACT
MATPLPETMTPAARPRVSRRNQWEMSPMSGTLANPDPMPVAK